MKTLLLFIGITFCSLQFVNAQGIFAPLEDAVKNEIRPEAPSDNHTWVKGHWQYNSGKYYWIDGAYVTKLANHTWVDGKWTKNQITDMWTFQSGFWSQGSDDIVYNNQNYKSSSVSSGNVVELMQPQNLSAN